ncbi:homocysteine S-methyltransferase family protein, partial [Pseudophaeobacter sp.]
MQITLLDGSVGQEVVKRSGERPTPLWSASVMMDQPDLVGAVHGDYFAAGATIATTNTYTVHRDRLLGAGLEDRFETLLDIAMAQAKAARDAHG